MKKQFLSVAALLLIIFFSTCNHSTVTFTVQVVSGDNQAADYLWRLRS